MALSGVMDGRIVRIRTSHGRLADIDYVGAAVAVVRALGVAPAASGWATACGPLLGRVAFEDAPFELWIRDADGRLILENAAARGWGNVIGLRTEESPVAAEVLPAWLEANRRAYAGGDSRDGASAGDRRLGGEITLELALTVACV